jgi:hypothetical protein
VRCRPEVQGIEDAARPHRGDARRRGSPTKDAGSRGRGSLAKKALPPESVIATILQRNRRFELHPDPPRRRREQAKIHRSIHLRTPPHLSGGVTSILQRMELRRRHLLPLLSILSGESRRGQARWAELLHPFLIVFLPTVAARGEAAAPAGPCPSSSSPTAALLLSLL